MQPEALWDERWETEVVPRLPSEMESQARELKAFVRVREVMCVSDLVRARLSYVLGATSFRRLGMWAVLVGVATLSEAAWRKRLRKASAWLLWLLGELLAVPEQARWLEGRVTGRVLLVDATRLREPGGCGDDWRVHTAYDLRRGRLAEVTVTDRHEAESLRHFQLRAGDIVVADNGYGYRRSVATVRACQADGVFRITPCSFPLEDEHEQPIDVLRWLRRRGASQRSLACWCRWQGQRSAVRLSALKLSPERARQARAAKVQKAKKKGHAITDETIFVAGWVLLITTLPEEQWSSEEVLRLYRARWQIELVYKRMKQLLPLAHLRSAHVESVQATIRLMLIAWVLQEEEASQIRAQLSQVIQTSGTPAEAMEAAVISSWLLTGLCLETLRQQVQGGWTRARLRACLPKLRRYLVSRPRKRVHQESTIRAWLAPPSRKGRTHAHAC